MELCSYPTPTRSGTVYIDYDETQSERRSTLIEVVSGQTPVLNQTFIVTNGDAGTSIFHAELKYDNYQTFYYHLVIYDRLRRNFRAPTKLEN